ncbi:hypothetical protein [Streptomyces sp. NPDC000618]|uniref:hypothetical protein n=1 Tax=Streptomyces sp. NPDC000618 TaxID=3154265 RepID=UPI003331BB3B
MDLRNLLRPHPQAPAVAPIPDPAPPAKPVPVPVPAVGTGADAARDADDGLVVHGEPIDIGWAYGSLDARLRLSVRPGMDPAERDRLLADLRDALALVVPVRRPGQEA